MGTRLWSQTGTLIFFVCAIVCLLNFPLSLAHSEQIQTSKGYLFHADDVPFSIDYDLHVALAGFNGDGARRIALESDDLQQSLKHSLPSDRPVCVQTGRLLHIQNNVQYDVFHTSTHIMEELEKVIGSNMVRAKDARGQPLFLIPPPPPSATFRREDEDVPMRIALPVYDVELSKVDKKLAKLLEQSLESHMQVLASKTSAMPSKENAMLIMNPDKNRIHAHIPDKPKEPEFLYRYRLGDAPASRAWIGFGRYVMVDLTAMSQTYGVTQSGKGTVSHTTIPDIQTQLDYKYASTKMSQDELLASYNNNDGTHQPSVKFMSRLATMVTSAVRKVFLGDVRFKSLDASERVVVPIITLTNHDVTNTLASGFNLNVNRITKVVKKLLLPTQELLVTQISHSLYSHPALAESVFRALTETTTHVMGKDGKYAAETVAYLDSEVLVAELLQSAQSNALLSSIVQVNKLSQSRGEQMQQEHNKLAVQAIVNAAKQHQKHAGGHASNRYSKDIDITEVYREGVLKQRIVPVFVYSIVGLPPATLIDKGSLAVPVAGGSMVIALQTPNADVPTPLFSTSAGKVTIDARDPTRDVIAALATAIGGIMPPHEEYDIMTQRLETDYTWAMGLHPFAQFSGSYKLSKLYRDVAKRNGIVTRLSNGVRKVKKAVALIGRFYDDYVGSPLGASQQRSDREARARAQANEKRGKTEKERGLVVSHRATEWLQSLVPAGDLTAAEHSAAVLKSIENAEVLSPFAAAVLGGFVRDLSTLDNDLYEVGQYLQESGNRVRIHEYWREGYYRSAKFLSRAAAFLDTVQTELSRARAEMSCCRKMYTSTVSAVSPMGKYPHRRGKAQQILVGADGSPTVAPLPPRMSSSAESTWTMWLYIGLAFFAIALIVFVAWLWTKSQEKAPRVAVRPGAHTSHYAATNAPTGGYTATGAAGSINSMATSDAAQSHMYGLANTQPQQQQQPSNPYMAAPEPAAPAPAPSFGVYTRSSATNTLSPSAQPLTQPLLDSTSPSSSSTGSSNDAQATGFAAYLQQDRPAPANAMSANPMSGLQSARSAPTPTFTSPNNAALAPPTASATASAAGNATSASAFSLPAPPRAPFSPPHNPFAASTQPFAAPVLPSATLPPAAAAGAGAAGSSMPAASNSSVPAMPSLPTFNSPRSPMTFPSLPTFSSPARATAPATASAGFAPRTTPQPLSLPTAPSSTTPSASQPSFPSANPFPSVPNVPLSTAHATYAQNTSSTTFPNNTFSNNTFSSPSAGAPAAAGFAAPARTPISLPTYPGASPLARSTPTLPQFPGASPMAGTGAGAGAGVNGLSGVGGIGGAPATGMPPFGTAARSPFGAFPGAAQKKE